MLVGPLLKCSVHVRHSRFEMQSAVPRTAELKLCAVKSIDLNRVCVCFFAGRFIWLFVCLRVHLFGFVCLFVFVFVWLCCFMVVFVCLLFVRSSSLSFVCLRARLSVCCFVGLIFVCACSFVCASVSLCAISSVCPFDCLCVWLFVGMMVCWRGWLHVCCCVSACVVVGRFLVRSSV